MRALRFVMVAVVAVMLVGCKTSAGKTVAAQWDSLTAPPPPVIRQPVLPELLKPCRGHVLVPALGMTFVPRGRTPPGKGEYLREESLSPPYRIVPQGARVDPQEDPERLNVEIDHYNRIVGLYCG